MYVGSRAAGRTLGTQPAYHTAGSLLGTSERQHRRSPQNLDWGDPAVPPAVAPGLHRLWTVAGSFWRLVGTYSICATP